MQASAFSCFGTNVSWKGAAFHPHICPAMLKHKQNSTALQLTRCTASNHANPVLIHDGVAVTAPASPQQLLAEHRQWSYTTALARHGRYVVDWELHLARLVRNIQLLNQQRPPAYAAYLAWLQQQPSSMPAEAVLDSIIRPQVAQALQLLAPELHQQQPPQADAMVAVLVTDPKHPQAATGTDRTVPLSVYVWGKLLPLSTTTKPAKVLVAGSPRDLAQAKHCDWVVARRPLEQLKQQAGVDEVILSDSSGALLEGLATNWFVVADAAKLAELQGSAACIGKDEAAADAAGLVRSSSEVNADAYMSSTTGPSQAAIGASSGVTSTSSSTAGLVLLTTGVDHAALPGISQRRILQACDQIGLKVVHQPTRVEECAAWREAFISNCVKGIQPVSSVQTPTGTVWQMPAEAGDVTHVLQQAMVQCQVAVDMCST